MSLLPVLPTAPASASLRFLPMRDGALMIELADLAATLALFDALQAANLPGILEIIPAARTLLLRFDPSMLRASDIEREACARAGQGRKSEAGVLVEIPVFYDGEDLAEVADLVGIAPEEVIQRHTQAEYTVAFTGFAPGFAYLSAGDAGLTAPRRTSPRTLVPAGAVGLAGEFSGIYPKASPGGWQLIGRTPLVMFDLAREPAALLTPGARVRFRDMAKEPGASVVVPVAASEITSSAQDRQQAALEVLSAGLPALVQDLGRPGLAGQGISQSGAADRGSLKAANRLVGNRPEAPALELAPTEFRFKALKRAVIALAGAAERIEIAPETGAKRVFAANHPVALERGDVVRISAPQRGMRSYLALRGGLDVPMVLGSAASDTLAQLGPEPVVAGVRLCAGPLPREAVADAPYLPATVLPAAGEVVALEVVLGPRTDWFTDAALADFLGQDWEVTALASRVGLRLAGPDLTRAIGGELPSEGALRGAIQVPANGQPVLFLADHPLTGGYPVIANVVSHHLDFAGQIPPGARIRFVAARTFKDIKPCSGAPT